jgi:hypothetical protein
VAALIIEGMLAGRPAASPATAPLPRSGAGDKEAP